jgi:hypothetical protein
MREQLGAEEMAELAEFNRAGVKAILEKIGYDFDYLMEWGTPDYWEEEFWSYPDYVMALFSHYEKVYGFHVPDEIFESVFPDSLD